MPNQDPSIASELLSHQTFLKRLAIDLVGHDADDLVQDVWQRALERPPHHGLQLRGWLARIARNLAANRWRGDARRADREARRASAQPTVDELEARLVMRKELVEALDSLSEPCREAILLRYFEGLAPHDIAQRLGSPLATVKTRLRRGLAQLREVLDGRYDGDRSSWMSAVGALGAPAGRGIESGTLVLGGMVMGTMAKVVAAILVVALGMYFVTRAPQAESARAGAIGLPPASVDSGTGEVGQVAEVGGVNSIGERAEAKGLRSATEEPLVDVSATAGESLLRVVLENVTEAEARLATITLMGVDERDGWPTEIGHSWPCQGLASELDLDPALATVARLDHLRTGELEVMVTHPRFLGARIRNPLAQVAELEEGRVVHEVRVRLVRPEFWPEFTLDVRDVHTREHIENVELRIAAGPGMAAWGRNAMSTLLGDGLTSPIELMGGRDADESEMRVAGLALTPAAGAASGLVELTHRWPPQRGVRVSARAPGYAWGSISLDVSEGARELLLEPSTTLAVQLTNVQLERYAALEAVPMLCVYRLHEDGGYQYVHFEQLDETLEAEGLTLESIVPGEYRITVELGGGSWTKQPVLALAEVALAAGATRELTLTLDDPPPAPKRAALGGVVSFPAPAGTWAEDNVRLQIYFQPTQKWREPDLEFSLAELQRVAGALPSWSFRVDDLPVGMYRVQLMPFLKVWMIELEAAGALDLELVLPELAEVLVETVAGRTGERVPESELYYRCREPAPGQRRRDLARAATEEPGLFRFWAAPGAVRIWPKFPNGAEREFGGNGMDLELIPGLQSVKFEFAPEFTLRFEFRADGTVLPTGPQGLQTTRDIRAVDHEGRVTDGGLQRDMFVEVSGPGLYEISFQGIDSERYHEVPPRVVEVLAGSTTEVIVELRQR